MAKATATNTAFAAAQEKLKELRQQQQQAIKDKSTAAQDGDLRENAYYHAAKETAERLAKNIGSLELDLQTVTPQPINLDTLGKANAEKGVVGMGVELTIYWKEEKQTENFRVVSALDEPGIDNGLKYNSPLAQRLANKTAGQEVTFRGSTILIQEIKPPTQTQEAQLAR
jgi:transcription elongation factor GreA